jgi:hypothetical protein
MKKLLSIVLLVLLSGCASTRPCNCSDKRVDYFMQVQEKYGDKLTLDEKMDYVQSQMTLDTMRMLVEEVQKAAAWNQQWWVIFK